MDKLKKILIFNMPFQLAVSVYLLGFILTLASTYHNLRIPVKQSMPEVLGRQYPLAEPDIHAGDGGTLKVEGVVGIVESGTFDRSVYLRVDRIARTNPKSVGEWWQVSDIFETRFRFHDNDNDVKQIETKKNYILAFPYSQSFLTTDQGVQFNENQLKLARGETIAGPWEILGNVAVDAGNDNISLITNRGGVYMVVGGVNNTPLQIPRNPSKRLPTISVVQPKKEMDSKDMEEDEIDITQKPIVKPTVQPKLSKTPPTVVESVSNLKSAFFDLGMAILNMRF